MEGTHAALGTFIRQVEAIATRVQDCDQGVVGEQ